MKKRAFIKERPKLLSPFQFRILNIGFQAYPRAEDLDEWWPRLLTCVFLTVSVFSHYIYLHICIHRIWEFKWATGSLATFRLFKSIVGIKIASKYFLNDRGSEHKNLHFNRSKTVWFMGLMVGRRYVCMWGEGVEGGVGARWELGLKLKAHNIKTVA